MEVKLSSDLIVALTQKGMIEDNHDKCTVCTKGLKFQNAIGEVVLIDWEDLMTL